MKQPAAEWVAGRDERRSHILMAVILEAAIRTHDAGQQDAHKYLDALVDGGAIAAQEAENLHDTLVVWRGYPRG